MVKSRKNKKCVVLLSGGIDSCVSCAIAKKEGYRIWALTFDYGQRHRKEIEHAKKIAKFFKIKEHLILKIDLRKIGGSALTSDSIKVPKKRSLKEITKKIPPTYVPARNTIFLSFALSLAEKISAESIFIGANCIDFSGYPDCRPQYFKVFEELIKVGTKKGVEGYPIKIRTPLINLTKAEIIKKGIELKAPLELTWSCYEGKRFACGECDACKLRLKGFKEAGLKDPIKYAKS